MITIEIPLWAFYTLLGMWFLHGILSAVLAHQEKEIAKLKIQIEKERQA